MKWLLLGFVITLLVLFLIFMIRTPKHKENSKAKSVHFSNFH